MNSSQLPKSSQQEKHTQPYYLRPSVSKSVLNKNPEYDILFHKCPSCDNYSLKPVGYRNMSPGYIRQNERNLERRCGVCNYTHKPSEK